MQDLIEGRKKNMKIKYFFIDEVQDYLLFQMIYMRSIFLFVSMMVFGDINQFIYVYVIYGVKCMDVCFEGELVEYVCLKRMYRLIRQIVELIKVMFQDGVDIEFFNRNGEIFFIFKIEGCEDFC